MKNNIKIILLFYFTIIISFNLYSEFESSISDLIKEGRILLNESHYELAIKNFNNALKQAKLLDSSLKIGESSYYISLCYVKLKQFDVAEKYINSSFYELKLYENDLFATLLLLKANIAKEKQSIVEAKEQAEKVLALKNISNDTIIRAHLFIIEIMLDQNDKDEANKYLTRLKKIIYKTNKTFLKGWYYNLQGSYYSLVLEYEKAAECYSFMVKEYKKIKSHVKIAYGLELIAHAYENARKFKKAVSFYFRSARCYLSANNTVKGRLNLSLAMNLMQYASEDLKEQINILLDEEKKNN